MRHKPRPGTTRRQFLVGSGVLGMGAAAATAPGVALAAPAATTVDYTARETFDRFDREFVASGNVGQATDTNEHGALGWGQAYVLLAFLRMYEKYADTHYLDRLVENFEAVLDERDSARGVTDYRGLSLPAWRAMNPYTVGAVDLPDAAGNAVLRVRSARAYADTTTATVTTGAADGVFTLAVTNHTYRSTATYADLTLDPADTNYAPRRIYNAYPGDVAVTAADLRDRPAAGAAPAAGTWNLSSLPAIFAVHTGQITYGPATFCRMVRLDGQLRSRYWSVAQRFLAALEGAVAVHDREWGTDGEIGWIRPVKGTPVFTDGTIQPLNQANILGATYGELFAATGDSRYRDRVRLLARGFERSITVDAGGADVWPYWPVYSEDYVGYRKTGSPDTDISAYTPSGGPARQIEDISHGALSVEFATTAYRHRIGLQSADIAAMAKTYAQNIARHDANGVPYAAWQLNGAGNAGANSVQAPRWVPVAAWDRRVFTHSLAVFSQATPEPTSGSLLLGVAYLNLGRVA